MLKNKVKRIITNLLVVFILYGNINGMMEAWQIRFESASYWQLPYFSNLFYIYGVFKEVHTQSREFVAFGSNSAMDTSTKKQADDLIDLKIHDFFPQSHGEANQRLSFAGIINQPERMEREYQRMAEMIKNIYNRKNPEQNVNNVFIYLYYWPADPNGYYYRSKEASVLFLGSNVK